MIQTIIKRTADVFERGIWFQEPQKCRSTHMFGIFFERLFEQLPLVAKRTVDHVSTDASCFHNVINRGLGVPARGKFLHCPR